MKCTILLLSLILFSSCHKDTPPVTAPVEKENSFEIYYLADKSLTYLDIAKEPLSELTLEQKPILSHKDMDTVLISEKNDLHIEYRLSFNHSITGVFGDHARPFVLVLNGEKYFIGECWPNLMNTVPLGVLLYRLSEGAIFLKSIDEKTYNTLKDAHIVEVLQKTGVLIQYEYENSQIYLEDKPLIPLALGNVWIYSDTSLTIYRDTTVKIFTRTYNISDTYEKDGITFYSFNDQLAFLWPWVYQTGDTFYAVHSFKSDGTRDEAMIFFAPKPGEKIVYYPNSQFGYKGEAWTASFSNVPLKTPLGTFSEYYKFETSWYHIYVVRGYGIVKTTRHTFNLLTHQEYISVSYLQSLTTNITSVDP